MLVSFPKKSSFGANWQFRVFEMALRGRDISPVMAMGNDKQCFWRFKHFSKLKTTFCTYWTYMKIKNSMTCMYQSRSQNRNGIAAMTTAWNEIFIEL